MVVYLPAFAAAAVLPRAAAAMPPFWLDGRTCVTTEGVPQFVVFVDFRVIPVDDAGLTAILLQVGQDIVDSFSSRRHSAG
jgi:hypothetical protein